MRLIAQSSPESIQGYQISPAMIYPRPILTIYFYIYIIGPMVYDTSVSDIIQLNLDNKGLLICESFKQVHIPEENEIKLYLSIKGRK